MQILHILNIQKPVVFTGHSIGGTIASLSALWLLSYLKSISSSLSVLCITFGSPMLGNSALSQAILQERWAGNFFHIVGKHDIVPRLLFAPLAPVTSHLHSLLQLWHFSTTSLYSKELASQHLPEPQNSDFFHFVLACVERVAQEEGATNCFAFWPFGNYMFCSNEGAVCVENDMAVVKLLHLMFATGFAGSAVEDHLMYDNYVGKLSLQVLKRRDYFGGVLPDSNYEAGLALALQSSGLTSHELVYAPAQDCLKMAKRIGRAPNLNSANLAIGLSKITPLRAQIEWYKAFCDNSDDQMGYYDSFKSRGASKRDFRVDMNRKKLAHFWNELIRMLETNQLPHDFHKRAKWVNASQFYKLLVEPLDIAEYYRSQMHKKKGHYIKHGRERRYKIFDKWWKDRNVEEENNTRSKFASLTQDTCFWAKVEEAREWLEDVRRDSEPGKLSFLWESICEFDHYAKRMVERKEVSSDVLAKNSSYSLWVEELKMLSLQLQKFPPQYPVFLEGQVVP